MNELLDNLREYLENDTVRAALRAVGIILAGWLVSRILTRKLRVDSLRAQHRLLLRRILSGLIFGISFAWAMSELGLNVGVVLGAAGVLTVAIGFAAQASVSNLISGLFLVVEQPFQITDVIKVGSTTGEVVGIDLMSTKLRTFDNLYVRIPNETILKAEVTNLTHYPIRRYDLQVGIAYREDIARVRDLLFELAYENPICLHEPKPLLIFIGYGDSAINLQFSVWAAQANFLQLRNSIPEQVKQVFDDNDIEIPFPHRSIYAGSRTEPLPIRMVGP